MTTASPSNDPTLRERVAALGAMNLEALREVWRAEFDDPPKLRSVELLRHLLAWRLQAAQYGGLDRATRQALKETARSGSKGRLQVGDAAGARAPRDRAPGRSD